MMGMGGARVPPWAPQPETPGPLVAVHRDDLSLAPPLAAPLGNGDPLRVSVAFDAAARPCFVLGRESPTLGGPGPNLNRMPFAANRRRPSVRRTHNNVRGTRLSVGRHPPSVGRSRFNAGRRPHGVRGTRLSVGRHPPSVRRSRLGVGRGPPSVRRTRPPVGRVCPRLGHVSHRLGRGPFAFNRSAMSFEPECLRLNRARLGFVHAALALGRFPPNRHWERLGPTPRPSASRLPRAIPPSGSASHRTTSAYFTLGLRTALPSLMPTSKSIGLPCFSRSFALDARRLSARFS